MLYMQMFFAVLPKVADYSPLPFRQHLMVAYVAAGVFDGYWSRPAKKLM